MIEFYNALTSLHFKTGPLGQTHTLYNALDRTTGLGFVIALCR